MTIKTTSKEQSTRGLHSTAETEISNLELLTAMGPDKIFWTLRAAYAMRSYTLRRTDSKDGPVTYWAEHWGLAHHLPSMQEARAFLVQVGGQL